MLFTEGKQRSSERQGLAAPAELRAEPSLRTGSILPPSEAESAEMPRGSVLNGSKGSAWATAGVWHVAIPPLCPDESPGCSFAARSCIVLPTLPLFCGVGGLFLIVTSLLFALRSPVDEAERTRSAYSALGRAPRAGRYWGWLPTQGRRGLVVALAGDLDTAILFSHIGCWWDRSVTAAWSSIEIDYISFTENSLSN